MLLLKGLPVCLSVCLSVSVFGHFSFCARSVPNMSLKLLLMIRVRLMIGFSVTIMVRIKVYG